MGGTGLNSVVDGVAEVDGVTEVDGVAEVDGAAEVNRVTEVDGAAVVDGAAEVDGAGTGRFVVGILVDALKQNHNMIIIIHSCSDCALPTTIGLRRRRYRVH